MIVTITSKTSLSLAGYYCPQKSTHSKQEPCGAGAWCKKGARYNCGPGRYNPKTDSSDINDCKSCPAGQYCEGKEMEGIR